MARPILPTIDFRTSAQREGITRTQQTVQAIAGIMQTAGLAEQKRRERLQLDRITRALSEGATTIEAIAAAAREETGFSKGLPGALQRFSGAFQPSPGGIEQSIAQSIIGQKLKEVLAPKFEKPSGAFAEGTVTQRGPTGKIDVLQQPSKTDRFGVTPWYLSPQWANKPAGIKAREKAFEGMTKEERIKALQTGLNAAAGQYFYQEGLEGGAAQPKNPIIYDYYADLLRAEGIPVKERSGRQSNSGGGLPKTGPIAGPNVGPKKYKYTATNPEGKKVGSNDGIKWEPIR